MREDFSQLTSEILAADSGSGAHAHIEWTSRVDGPMNVVGKEFPFDPLVPFHVAGDQERIANRLSFFDQIGINPVFIAVPKLTHSAKIGYANQTNEYLEDLQFDGVLTDTRRFSICMPFADCPAVVLYDGDAGALLVMHCGWKGIAGGIVENGFDMMTRFGARKSRIKAFISPGARGCCYEVAPDVAAKVDGLPHQGYVKIDLPDIILTRLVAKGVKIEGIKQHPHCTICAMDNDNRRPLYYSYRRDKKNDPLDANMLVAYIA